METGEGLGTSASSRFPLLVARGAAAWNALHAQTGIFNKALLCFFVLFFNLELQLVNKPGSELPFYKLLQMVNLHLFKKMHVQ